MMTGSNKIPIKITNDIINTIDSYGVNTFIVEIPLANNANLLNSMIEETSLAEKTTLYNKEYVFNFGFYFEIEYIDKFPVNFI
jgi:hypothetical protein